MTVSSLLYQSRISSTQYPSGEPGSIGPSQLLQLCGVGAEIPQVRHNRTWVPVTNKFEGNDGSWSTFMINVGVPTGQNFRVLVSTASSITWVPSTAGCTTSDPPDCPQLRGVENFAGAKSQGYDPQESQGSNDLSSSIGLYELQLGTSTFQSVYGANYSGINATVYSDVEGLGPYSSTTPEIADEAIAAIASKSVFMGSFGLNIVPNNFGTGDLATFLTQYANSTPGVPSKSLRLFCGSKLSTWRLLRQPRPWRL